MNGHGGKRVGAGRKVGEVTRRTLEIRAASQVHAAAALATLAEIARNGESESSRVAASTALLDRAYGRPAQAVQHQGPDGGAIQVVQVMLIGGKPVKF